MTRQSKKKRPLTVEQLWQIQRIGTPSLAPGGGQVVCPTTSYDMEANTASTQLWLLPTRPGVAPRQLTTCGDKDGQPAWSPQGGCIAFVARRDQQGHADKTAQLYVIDAAGGEARRVSDLAPGVESFKWCPDGQRIVFAAWVWPDLKGAAAQSRRHLEVAERKTTGHVTSEAFYRHWDRNLPQDRVLHLLLLEVASGRITDLFEGTPLQLPRDGGGNDAYDISADGQRIAFVHDPAAVQVAGNPNALGEMALRTRRVLRTLADPAWNFTLPVYAPHGRRLAFCAAHAAVHHQARPQPALLDEAGADAGQGWRLLAPAWDGTPNPPLRWSAAADAIYFAAEQQGRCHLWRQALDAVEPVVAHRGGWVTGFDIATRSAAADDASGDVVVVAADAIDHPVRLFARHGDNPPQRLDRCNDELLAGVRMGKAHAVSVTGASGDAVQLWLVEPPDFDAKRRHAVTHVIHGGPFAAAGDTFSYRWNPHVLAAGGRVVAQVNYHGSSGFGSAFAHSTVGRQGELELQDIEAATDWLLQQRWVDAKRICAAGGSYGGFLVAWMNGHVATGRYRAYICHAGVYDRIATFSADSYTQRPKDLAARYWDDMPRVLAQSPHRFAAAMATPTLVVHGAQDFRVPDCNGLAHYNTLKARGVDARLLWFPDENHWVLKPRNSRLWYAEFAAWIDAHAPQRKGGK